MDKVSDPAFRVMCDMWGVDGAIKAARRMGFAPSEEQIEAERQKEKASQERFNAIFKSKEG